MYVKAGGNKDDLLKINEEDCESFVGADTKSVCLTLGIFGCCTAQLKSPIRLLLYALGNSPVEERKALTKPVAVYKYYHNAG